MPAPKNNKQENKIQPSLIPLDIILPMLEPAYREGIIKYKRESWRKGFNATVMYDALQRHLNKWFYDLESFDPEAKEKHNINKHHLGAAMFCLINLYHMEFHYPELDDRPVKRIFHATPSPGDFLACNKYKDDRGKKNLHESQIDYLEAKE